MKRFWIVSAMFTVLGLAGCDKASVSVKCVTTAAPAVECDLTQTAGKAEVETCFDFEATCENGVVVKAPRTCGKVKDGGSTKVVIPGDQLENVGDCAGSSPPKVTLKNQTLDGK
jgi:hypothetical protein